MVLLPHSISPNLIDRVR